MDLWDVAKLMARRWFIAVPMILATVGIALWTTSVVKPDYTATTNVTLLPPVLRNENPAGVTRRVNPWDTDSLTIATLTYLNSKRLHDQFEERGLSEVWQADTDIRFRSLIIIEVTAEGPELAQRTVRELQRLVTEEVARQQAKYNLKAGEEITTILFDNGDNLETATSKVKRALIVVVGVGLILTVAVTVGVDALLRWRAARRRIREESAVEEVPDAPEQAATPQQPPTPEQSATPQRQPATPQREKAPTAAPAPATVTQPITVKALRRTGTEAATAGDDEETQLLRIGAEGARPAKAPRVVNVPTVPGVPSSEETQVLRIATSPTASAKTNGEEVRRLPKGVYQTRAGTDGVARSSGVQRPPDAGPPQEDATVVLPLSNATWGGKLSRIRKTIKTAEEQTAENGNR